MAVSVFLVTDVSWLGRIKYQIADGSNQTVNAEGDTGQEEIASRAGRVAFRFQIGVVDDQTSEPVQKESQKKAGDFVVHVTNLLFGIIPFGIVFIITERECFVNQRKSFFADNTANGG